MIVSFCYLEVGISSGDLRVQRSQEKCEEASKKVYWVTGSPYASPGSHTCCRWWSSAAATGPGGATATSWDGRKRWRAGGGEDRGAVWWLLSSAEAVKKPTVRPGADNDNNIVSPQDAGQWYVFTTHTSARNGRAAPNPSASIPPANRRCAGVGRRLRQVP